MPRRRTKRRLSGPIASLLLGFLAIASVMLALPLHQAPPVGAIAHAASPPAIDSAVVDDAIILLDVTGSMRGAGPDRRAQDIWDQVLAAVLDIVDRLAPGTNLAIVPFSAGPEWPRVFPGPLQRGAQLAPRPLIATSDREEFKAYLRQLPVRGEVTWVYESVEYALDQLKIWREDDPARTHRQALFLYTDGIDTGSHASGGLPALADLFRAKRGDFPLLYAVYVDLGRNVPPGGPLAAAGVAVVSGPPPSVVEIVSKELDFGDLTASPGGVTREVNFSSRFADAWGRPLRVRVEVTGRTLPVALAPDTPGLAERLSLTLRPTGPLPPSDQRARLIFESPEGGFVLAPLNSVAITFGSAGSLTATARASAGTAAAAATATAEARATVTAQAASTAQTATAVPLASATAAALAAAKATAQVQTASTAQVEALAAARRRASATAGARATSTSAAESTAAAATATALAPTATVLPAAIPLPAATAACCQVGGIPDPILYALLGVLPLFGLAGAVAWRKSFWPFVAPPGSEYHLWYAEGAAPQTGFRGGARRKVIQPDRVSKMQTWTIGTSGYIALPREQSEGAVMPQHAELRYDGKKHFLVRPVEGQVRVDGEIITAEGRELTPGTTFAVGAWYFTFTTPPEPSPV